MNKEKIDFRNITYPFMRIEPKNKTQQKQLDANRIRLNITESQEDFVLNCLANRSKTAGKFKWEYKNEKFINQ